MPNLRVAAFLFASGLVACSSSHSGDDLGAPDAAVPDAAAFDAATVPDAAEPTDGSIGDAAVDASPITAPADTWTWVDFPESRCANDSATGLGVNLHPGATNVLVYFEGGGACSSADTCWGATPQAKNLNGYNATTFMNAETADSSVSCSLPSNVAFAASTLNSA